MARQGPAAIKFKYKRATPLTFKNYPITPKQRSKMKFKQVGRQQIGIGPAYKGTKGLSKSALHTASQGHSKIVHARAKWGAAYGPLSKNYRAGKKQLKSVGYKPGAFRGNVVRKRRITYNRGYHGRFS